MPSSQRSLAVDVLRGTAIILVLLGHSLRYIYNWSTFLPIDVRQSIITGAYYGVTIFFVISGYLITGKFVQTTTDELQIDAKDFYGARAGRILPPLALLLTVTLTISLLLGAPFDIYLVGKSFWSLIIFEFNGVAQNFPHTESALDPLWSLRNEEIFYIFMPILIIIAGQRRAAAIILLSICILGNIFRLDDSQRAYAFFSTWDQLAFGALVALYKEKLAQFLGLIARFIMKTVAAAIIVTLYFTTAMTDSAFCVTGVALGAALYLLSIPAHETGSNFVSRGVASFGRLSYEIYLSHMIVFWAFSGLAARYPILRQPGIGAISLVLAAIFIIYVISAMVAFFYSEPLNRAVRRFFSSNKKMIKPIITVEDLPMSAIR